MTPEEMSLRGKVGINVRLSRENTDEMIAPARAGFLAKFEREVDPDGELDAGERARRADCAMRAHMARLALKSVKARKKAA